MIDIRRAGLGLVVFTIAIAVIATQWPFHYDLSREGLAEKWSEVDWTWFHYTRSGRIKFDRDFAQNLLMLVPLGVGWASWRRGSWGLVAQATAVGFLVSLALELAQLLTSDRFTQLDDLWRNTLGCGVGALVVIVVRGRERPE